LRRSLSDALRQLTGQSSEELVDQRIQRLMGYGRFQDVRA